jgi:CheY-like chemotaxis protein
MPMAATKSPPMPQYSEREVARVLLVDDDPASRLTLQTVLKAGGYGVDTAATSGEAISRMEADEYALVLSDLHMESPEAGLRVMEHARLMDYRPATAIVNTWQQDSVDAGGRQGGVLIQPQNVPELLGQVADMIAERASRRLTRSMRH